MENKFYITIGRQKGAGGLELAHKLSKKLNIPVYDKQLLQIAAKESGLSPDIFEETDEKKVPKFFTTVFGSNFSTIFTEEGSSSIINREELFIIQSNTIQSIADKSSAIFVGRCADYVLRNRDKCLNIFITSSIEDRVDRLAKTEEFKDLKNMSIEQCESFLEKQDKKRSSYYNYFTYKEWGNATSYDLCINSSKISIDECVELIYNVIKNKWISF